MIHAQTLTSKSDMKWRCQNADICKGAGACKGCRCIRLGDAIYIVTSTKLMHVSTTEQDSRDIQLE